MAGKGKREPEVRRVGDAREVFDGLEGEREWLEDGDWWWCLHCEHVWHKDDLLLTRQGRRWWLGCGDRNCNGSLIDLWDYHQHRQEQSTWWPEEVQSGQAVPLYRK